MNLPNGPYKSSDNEAEILKKWLEAGIYKPEFNPKTNTIESFEDMLKRSEETWALITPPPNAYGRPHIGNISGYAYMDAMARYQRMKGKHVLMLPGKDHAGLEGEGVFVREVLEKQKRNKFEMNRDEFYSEMMEWMKDNMDQALTDEKEIGLSADFDRNTFTLDPDIVETVLDTFIEMYKGGMIYKGVRIINYDIKGRTAVADNQIEYKDAQTPFYYFKYSFLEPELFAIKVKNDFMGQTVDWEYQLQYEQDTEKPKPFYYGEIQDKSYTNPHDNDPLDIVAIGYSENKYSKGDVIKGKAVGIQMRLDRDYSLIVAREDMDQEEINKELNEYFLYSIGRRAGSHIIKFDDYPEDKFYTNGLIIGTVRPETIFADTAIACDPKDERYKDLVGKKIEVKFLGDKKTLNFIEDYSVDKDFGSGLLKVTPAHSVEDWEIAGRNPEECLPPIQVIGYDLRMNHLAGKYSGMRIKEARESMREDMLAFGNLVYVDDNYKNRVAIAERTKAPIEPLLSSQWYLKYDGIKEAAIKMVYEAHKDDTNLDQSVEEIEKEVEKFINKFKGSGGKKPDAVRIHPESMVSQFNHWMTNLRDWAISRSLWWGYRLPVWYAGEIKEEISEDGQVKEYIRLKSKKDKTTQLDIMRHSQSEDNAKGLVSGTKSDTPLSAKGIAEAEAFDPDRNYDLIITSTLKRAKQTGEILNKKLNLPIIESELIIEKNFGRIEGQHADMVLEEFPEFETIYDVYDHPDKIDAESRSSVRNRLEKFLEWIEQKHSGKKILVVAHGGIKKEFARILDLMEESAIKTWVPENLGITTAIIGGDSEWTPLEYDNPNHIRVQKKNPGDGWVQDENVLDTWFSSGQWVYSTLSKYGLMDKFFPTNVMVSGFDILENWISRMMMFTYFKHKQIPFKDVYLTGLVKGTDGQKMSKSKGNLINIDDVRAKYGTDAVRMVYYYQNSAGASYAMTYEKLDTFKKFVNKIWNASKFVLMNLEGFDTNNVILSGVEGGINPKVPEVEALLNHVKETKEHITKNIDDFDFGLATYNLYQAFWHEFADVHIEAVKPYVYVQKNWETGEIISEPDPVEKKEAQRVLHFALREYIKMLHPFMPFVTEKIWQEIPKVEGDHEFLMYTRW